MSISPFRPLTFGEILDGAFTLYRRHFLTLFITALVPYVPVGVLAGWMASYMPESGEISGVYLVLLLVVMVASLIAFPLMWAALTHQAAAAYSGGEVSLASGFRQGIRSFFFTLIAGGVALTVTYVVAFGAALVIGVGAALLIPMAGQAGAAVAVISVVLVVVAVVFMLALFAMFFAVVPAIVVERRGPFQAIGRSVSLAWGALPRVMGVTVVSWLILFLPIAGLMAFVAITQGVDKLLGTGGPMSPGAIAVQQLGTTVVYALVLPFFATSLVLLYFDRRARTEAHDLEGMVQGLAEPAPPPPVYGGA